MLAVSIHFPLESQLNIAKDSGLNVMHQSQNGQNHLAENPTPF
jgi:hypothetical protein